MSSSFRLKYFFGLIPNAQKIDSAWAELLKMRDELHLIETSKELARYQELKHLVQSNDFLTKKREIIDLSFNGSAENQLLTERTKLEHSKPIKDYFKFIASPDFVRLKSITESSELARFFELKKNVESPDFIRRKKEAESLRYKGSPEFHKRQEFNALQKNSRLKGYYATLVSDEYRVFLELDASEKEKLKDLSKKLDPKVIIYRKFLKSTAYQNIKKVEKLGLVTQFEQLKQETIVESPDFIRRKKEAESLRYKGSPEYIKRHKYNALQKNSRLKRYYVTIMSDEYRVFLELDASEKEKLKELSKKIDPKVIIYRKFLKSTAFQNFKKVEKLGLAAQFEQLKQETNAKPFLEYEAFLKNAARYETTADYPQFNEFTRLLKSSDIQFYLKCISSPLYANYQKIVDSRELARLKELRLSVEAPAFMQQVAFLKNKKRYETTPDFKLETELNELDKSKIITTYHQLKKRRELAFFDQWEIVLEENFTEHHLTSMLWEPENYWGSKMAGYSFSQINELQAYKGMKNIEIRNKVLSIVTKAEKTEGKVWDPAVGLVPQKFDYSSAILNTGNSFKFKEGVVEAKVKFRAAKAITSAFALTGSHPFPQIDVFRSGNKSVGLGIINQSGKGSVKKLVQIKGLNFNNFHIFRLEVFANELVWKINNHEVHRDQLPQNMGELFLHFIGSIHEPLNGGSLPHYFEIDWVRCLRKK